MNCPRHGSADRSPQRMPGLAPRLHDKGEILLPDDDFTSVDFERFGAQLGSQAVFFSFQKNNANDTGEAQTTKRNIRNRQHQVTL